MRPFRSQIPLLERHEIIPVLDATFSSLSSFRKRR
ncbi:hypothetical protein SOVF_198970 [Spinacia oleracea]|nr:hypothetical protein SOVF_198970 [Spinacia oleracea]